MRSAILIILCVLVTSHVAWALPLQVTGTGFISQAMELGSDLNLTAPGFQIGVGATVASVVPKIFDLLVPVSGDVSVPTAQTKFTNIGFGFIDDGVGSVTTPDAIYFVTGTSIFDCPFNGPFGRNCVNGSFTLTTPGIFLTPLTSGPATFTPLLTVDLPAHLDLFLHFQKDLFTDHATDFSQEFIGDGTWTIEIDHRCFLPDPANPCPFGGQFRWTTLGLSFAPVPEPATWLLLGSGMISLAWWRRKYHRILL